MAGRARRIALRDFVYRPRKARIELAAYAAHIRLPYYFGAYEWSIPIRSIAVVDLTAPGSPRETKQLQGEFLGRTITYLFTTARARTATTLLLFAGPQRVPPLRFGPALDPGVRPFLPFGYVSSRRDRGAWVDGVLLRMDDPKDGVDRLVAAGALRGVYRDGAWRVDAGEPAGRPAADPPWSRRSVDRCDGAARALVLTGTLVGWNLPNLAELFGRDVGFVEWSRYLDPDIPLWAWGAVGGLFALGFVFRLIATLLYRRAPIDVPPPGRMAPPGTGPSSVRPSPAGPSPGGPSPAPGAPSRETWPAVPPPPPASSSPVARPPVPSPPAPRSAARPRWVVPPADGPDHGQPQVAPPVGPQAMANAPSVGTVVAGRRPATRPDDPRGADRGRR